MMGIEQYSLSEKENYAVRIVEGEELIVVAVVVVAGVAGVNELEEDGRAEEEGNYDLVDCVSEGAEEVDCVVGLSGLEGFPGLLGDR